MNIAWTQLFEKFSRGFSQEMKFEKYYHTHILAFFPHMHIILQVHPETEMWMISAELALKIYLGQPLLKLFYHRFAIFNK
jgi:hypothetical protein